MIQPRHPTRSMLATLIGMGLLLVTGCGNDDERLLELSRESLRRQAEQNAQMARQSEQITEASRELVAADAEARREIVEVHHDIQAERQSLNRQHEDLESERLTIASQRHRDPIIANTLQTTGLFLAALLPLAVAWLLLKNQFSRSDDELLAEVLISEITSSTPVLLPPPGEAPRLLGSNTENLQRLGVGEDIVVSPAPVLVIVEGRHDIECLKRLSRILHEDDDRLPDLDAWEREQRVLFVPAGGDNIADWTTRLSALSQREFHLYDREGDTHARERQKLVDAVNSRPGCRAFLTGMRSLENYLHPDAIFEAHAIRVSFGDGECVATVVAQTQLKKKATGVWEQLSTRGRTRLRSAAKRWLNTDAVDCMTVEHIDERDSGGEIRSWLNAIAELASSAPSDPQVP